MGTTANLSDASGNVADHRTDPWGNYPSEGTSVNKQVFTGQDTMEQTGLIYFGARYYDPDTAGLLPRMVIYGAWDASQVCMVLYAYRNPCLLHRPY